MFSTRTLGSAILACTTTLWAQQMISLHSGLIHYTEGTVTVDGQQVENKNSEFSSLQKGQELRTGEGRAELLLTPGAFLRVGENSAVRMVSNALTDTQLEVLEGSALVEVTELGKDNAIAVSLHGAVLHVEKAGLFRVDANPGRFRVYSGQAFLAQGATNLSLTKGKEVAVDGSAGAAIAHFNADDSDDLYRWSARRSSYVSMANASLAKTAYTSDGAGGCYVGCWGYNSAFGMYSYLPYGGMAYSPFGFGFYSPYSSFYAPYFYYPTGYYPVAPTPVNPVRPTRGLPVVGGRSPGGFAQSTIASSRGGVASGARSTSAAVARGGSVSSGGFGHSGGMMSSGHSGGHR